MALIRRALRVLNSVWVCGTCGSVNFHGDPCSKGC